MDKGYRYLGILQDIENLQEKVMVNANKICNYRVSQVLKTKLTERMGGRGLKDDADDDDVVLTVLLSPL